MTPSTKKKNSSGNNEKSSRKNSPKRPAHFNLDLTSFETKKKPKKFKEFIENVDFESPKFQKRSKFEQAKKTYQKLSSQESFSENDRNSPIEKENQINRN